MLNWFNRLINQRQNTRVTNLDPNHNAGLDNFISDVSLTIFYTPLVLLNDDSSQIDNLVFVLIHAFANLSGQTAFFSK